MVCEYTNINNWFVLFPLLRPFWGGMTTILLFLFCFLYMLYCTLCRMFPFMSPICFYLLEPGRIHKQHCLPKQKASFIILALSTPPPLWIISVIVVLCVVSHHTYNYCQSQMGGIDMQQGLPAGFPVGAGGGMVHNIGVSHGRTCNMYTSSTSWDCYSYIRTALKIPTNLKLRQWTRHTPKANRGRKHVQFLRVAHIPQHHQQQQQQQKQQHNLSSLAELSVRPSAAPFLEA